MQMPTYAEVLSLAQRLNSEEQVQLLQALSQLVYPSIEVEGTDEVISATEIAESEGAWQDYLAGRDSGLSSQEWKRQRRGGSLADWVCDRTAWRCVQVLISRV